MMFNPETAPYAGYYMRPFEAAARSFGIEPIGAPVRDDADIERVIARLGRADPKGGLIVMTDIYTTTRREPINRLTARYGVPAINSTPTTTPRRRIDHLWCRHSRPFSSCGGVALSLGLTIQILNASTEPEIEAAFATIAQKGIGGLLVSGDALFTNRPKQIIALAARHAILAIYGWREHIAVGGLATYGASPADLISPDRHLYWQNSNWGRNLRTPPIIQPTKFELVINLKTAKAQRPNT